MDWWEHGPSDVLGRLHHPLKGLADVDGAISLQGHDATGQDALDGAVVLFGVDPGWHAGFILSPYKVEALMRPLDKSGAVVVPCQVLGDVDAEELKAADSLYCSPV